MNATDRRRDHRREALEGTPSIWLGLSLYQDRRDGERRNRLRRRSDVGTIAELCGVLGTKPALSTVAHRGRASQSVVVFECGCIASEPLVTGPPLMVMECHRHVAPEVRPNRRQTDHVAL